MAEIKIQDCCGIWNYTPTRFACVFLWKFPLKRRFAVVSAPAIRKHALFSQNIAQKYRCDNDLAMFLS